MMMSKYLWEISIKIHGDIPIMDVCEPYFMKHCLKYE